MYAIRLFKTGQTTCTIWSQNGHTYADATVEWVDGNLGSKLTMKYPSIYLLHTNHRLPDSKDGTGDSDSIYWYK